MNLPRPVRLNFSRELTVDAQIRALGYKIEDVKYVVARICISTTPAGFTCFHTPAS